jgi:hypothetical protein
MVLIPDSRKLTIETEHEVRHGVSRASFVKTAIENPLGKEGIAGPNRKKEGFLKEDNHGSGRALSYANHPGKRFFRNALFIGPGRYKLGDGGRQGRSGSPGNAALQSAI